MSLQWASPPDPRKTENEKLMSKERERKNPIQIYLSDDEKYILDNKVAASGMWSISEFIRHLIIYGYVYDIGYKDLREYDKQLSIIGKNINMIRERIDTFGCGIGTAKHDFKFALSQTNPSDRNQAFHLIQSFAKGEVSHEETHRIGIELADKLLEGKFSYIVATHTDKSQNCSFIQSNTTTINLFMINIKNPKIPTDTCVCTKPSSSSMTVQSECLKRWDLILNLLIPMRSEKTTRPCNHASIILRYLIKLLKKRLMALIKN